jgi:hypothetical protein
VFTRTIDVDDRMDTVNWAFGSGYDETGAIFNNVSETAETDIRETDYSQQTGQDPVNSGSIHISTICFKVPVAVVEMNLQKDDMRVSFE